jgi:hypothetical protein
MNWKRGLGFVFLALALLILVDALLSLSGVLGGSTNVFRDVVGIVLFAALALVMFRISK